MTDMPEPGRLSAHVMIDAVSAFDLDPVEAINVEAMDLALRRIGEIDGALMVEMSDEGDVAVDASNLIGGTLISLQWLVSSLAVARGVEREVIISELREFID